MSFDDNFKSKQKMHKLPEAFARPAQGSFDYFRWDPIPLPSCSNHEHAGYHLGEHKQGPFCSKPCYSLDHA